MNNKYSAEYIKAFMEDMITDKTVANEFIFGKAILSKEDELLYYHSEQTKHGEPIIIKIYGVTFYVYIIKSYEAGLA